MEFSAIELHSRLWLVPGGAHESAALADESLAASSRLTLMKDDLDAVRAKARALLAAQSAMHHISASGMSAPMPHPAQQQMPPPPPQQPFGTRTSFNTPASSSAYARR
jgi:hypothetical protein